MSLPSTEEVKHISTKEKEQVSHKGGDSAENPNEDSLEYVFATNTSCHGLRSIAESRSLSVRLIWTVLVLTALGFLAYQITKAITEYTKYEAVTELKLKYEHSLEFPAVTLCSFNRFRLTNVEAVADIANISDEDLLIYLYAGVQLDIGSLNDNTSYVLETVDRVEAALSLSGQPKDLPNLVYQCGYSRDALVKSCIWKGEGRRECGQNDFQDFTSGQGKCFTIHTGKNQTKQGYDNGLHLELDFHGDEGVELLSFNGYPEMGFRFLLHSPDVIPDVHNMGGIISIGSSTNIAIELTKFKNARPPWGTCQHFKLEFFDKYNIDNCMKECIMKYLREKCKCIPAMFPLRGDTPACSPREMITCVTQQFDLYEENREPCDPDCSNPCEFVMYRNTMSTAAIPNPIVAREYAEALNQSEAYISKNLATVNIYYQTLQVSLITQKPSKSIVGLIADLGGQTGLCIGMSLITIAEFIEYLIIKVRYILGRNNVMPLQTQQ